MTCVGWPKGEKLPYKFDLDQCEYKSSQFNPRPNWSRKKTQVVNLRLLACPFGQGLTLGQYKKYYWKDVFHGPPGIRELGYWFRLPAAFSRRTGA